MVILSMRTRTAECWTTKSKLGCFEAGVSRSTILEQFSGVASSLEPKLGFWGLIK